LSDGVTAKAIGKVRGVALGIIIALFTPDNGECSFVAIFAAMANFCGGNFLSPQAGALLLEQLGVTRLDYSQLSTAILIRAGCRLLPLGALWLVPDGTPTDEEFLERLKHVAHPQSNLGLGWSAVAKSDTDHDTATTKSPRGTSAPTDGQSLEPGAE
jgi:hypothetical protein